MRVVFDTNIYVSAFILPGSSADRAMRRIFDGHDTLLISKPILDELLTTLARKFSRDADALSRTALLLTELAELIQPKERVSVFEDDPDNRILECETKKKGSVVFFAHVDCAFKIIAQQVVKGMSRTVPAQSLSRPIVERCLQPLHLAPRESIEPGA